MRLEEEIRALAGEPLNPGSPKQLGDILFGKMGLAEVVGAKKTKTGAWSTSASVLEDLAELGHALPQKILAWRQVAKLRSTYTDALPGFINPNTSRVHTATRWRPPPPGGCRPPSPICRTSGAHRGRPQDPPRLHRRARHKLVSADYSQIELRLLAEIADIPALKQAFQDGLDIHAMTASEMFGVPIVGMPGEVRRRAQGDQFRHHLRHLGIRPRQSARHSPRRGGAYIKKYFRALPRHPRLHGRDEGVLPQERLRPHGVRTQMPLSRYHASNASIRSFNERAAINARLQGSAADIIRRAMVRMDDALTRERLTARMLLQVHDELIFEVPDAEVERTLHLVKKVMVDAPKPAIALTVPLQVDARAADNWEEAH